MFQDPVPRSARQLAALAAVVCLIPAVLVDVGYRASSLSVLIVTLVYGAACCGPLFLRDRDAFWLACVTAIVAVGFLSAPLVLASLYLVAWAGPFALLLNFVFAPLAGMPALVVAARRAHGRAGGHTATVFGWSTGVLSLVGWAAVAAFAIVKP
ncbi:hypothetical protein [Kitasatospora aureofaciens]|uniref:hypothetical protein n=1 Tax=Kitasatospora aureofaciens TaxID=1894 RepID=UPI00381581F0